MPRPEHHPTCKTCYFYVDELNPQVGAGHCFFNPPQTFPVLQGNRLSFPSSHTVVLEEQFCSHHPEIQAMLKAPERLVTLG